MALQSRAAVVPDVLHGSESHATLVAANDRAREFETTIDRLRSLRTATEDSSHGVLP
jgi:hypothetical protein